MKDVRDGRPTVVDLFCGAGGLSEGFRQAGFNTVLGVDQDPWAVKTFTRMHGNADNRRIEDLTGDMILTRAERNTITVMTAGPPCQAFSAVAVGKLKSLKRSVTMKNPLNQLFREFLRLVKEVNPAFFVMENVGRMFSIADGAIKKQIETELNERYRVNFYFEDVVNFGVPQFRKRGIAIGNRIGVINPELRHTHYDPELTTTASTGMMPYVTVKSAISDLPKIKAGEGEERMNYPHLSSLAKLSKFQVERRKHSDNVNNHVARTHCKRDLGIFRMLKPGQWIADLPCDCNPYRSDIFADRFKKQPWDRPSSTILAHLAKDGLMFIHPDPSQNRSLTPREAARLQSFDDSYFFEGPRTRQFIQIGNAVPPLFARAVASAILERLTISVNV